jgi:hypothetical protein
MPPLQVHHWNHWTCSCMSRHSCQIYTCNATSNFFGSVCFRIQVIPSPQPSLQLILSFMLREYRSCSIITWCNPSSKYYRMEFVLKGLHFKLLAKGVHHFVAISLYPNLECETRWSGDISIQRNLERSKYIYPWQIQGGISHTHEKRVQDHVTALYKYPPKLHHWYKRIRAIPLKDRLTRSTAHLKQWIAKVDHQVKATKYIEEISNARQRSFYLYCRPILSTQMTCFHKYPP